jgi:hypothetical protein
MVGAPPGVFPDLARPRWERAYEVFVIGIAGNLMISIRSAAEDRISRMAVVMNMTEDRSKANSGNDRW